MSVIKLAIIGSGDLGQLIAHHARLTGKFQVVGFFDDFAHSGTMRGDIPVIADSSEVLHCYHDGQFDQLLIAVGYKHFDSRESFYEKFKTEIPFGTVIHPSAIVDPSCKIGAGSVVLSGCILDQNVRIGDNVLLNTGVMVAHDSEVGDHSFLAPRCNIAGFVHIGQKNFIGIGANVIDNVRTISGVQIGGGALLHKSLDEEGLYVGVPARKIK
jgi:sugar O-acyltransferase (sialic acid O-acetyltransferase NeuD family)